VAAEIDVTIRGLKEYERRLREIRNALIAACRLPDEVFALIFKTFRPYGINGKVPARKLVFAQVCRHWRAIALRTGLLWTTPPFRQPSLAKAFLSRACSSPLNIYWHKYLMHYKGREDILEPIHMALSAPSVIRRLDLNDRLDVIVPLMDTFVDCGVLTHLEDLRLNVSGKTPTPYTLPSTLIHRPDYAIALQSLHLRNCSFVIHRPFLSGLTTLVISHHYKLRYKLKFMDILVILRCASELQRLYLDACIDKDSIAESAQEVEDTDMINLDYLRTLSVTDHQSIFVGLVQRLRMPKISSIATGDSKHMVQHIAPEELCLVLEVIWKCSGFAQWDPLESVSLDMHYTEGLEIVFLISSCALRGKKFAFCVEVHLFREEDWHSLFSQSAQMLRLDKTINFRYESELYDPSIENMMNALRLLTNVKTLELSDEGALTLLLALLHAASRNLPVCPNLDTIVIEDADMCNDVHPSTISQSLRELISNLLPSMAHRTIALVDLIKLLAVHRSTSDHPILIRLQSCDIQDQPLTSIEQLDLDLLDVRIPAATMRVMHLDDEVSVALDPEADIHEQSPED
jgi:hypothetical protein